jgi:hypothetical protein
MVLSKMNLTRMVSALDLDIPANLTNFDKVMD